MSQEAVDKFMKDWNLQTQSMGDKTTLQERITRVQYALTNNPQLICPNRTMKQR